MKNRDPEIEAMATCWEAVRKLSAKQRARLADWIGEKIAEPQNNFDGFVTLKFTESPTAAKAIADIAKGSPVIMSGLGLEDEPQAPLFPPGAVEGLQKRAGEVRESALPPIPRKLGECPRPDDTSCACAACKWAGEKLGEDA